MATDLPKNDLELHEAFNIIRTIESLSDYIIDISELIYNRELNRENISKILDKHNIQKLSDIKEELIDLLIIYINLILNDHIISDNEKYNVELLKKHFKIKEGDFYNMRYQEVEDVLHRQFERIYSDNKVDKEEALHSVDLQGLFNLSYDQFDKFKESEIIRAIEQGADITNLDTSRIPKLTVKPYNLQERPISKQIKDLVWTRDKGKCRECGNNKQLELSHIIPLSKGGSNTYRNIQLRCKSCSRKRSD